MHSVVDLRLLAWSAAEADDAENRILRRKDRYGHPIRWEDYEAKGSRFGWFIELIDPESVNSHQASARSATEAGNTRVARRRTAERAAGGVLQRAHGGRGARQGDQERLVACRGMGKERAGSAQGGREPGEGRHGLAFLEQRGAEFDVFALVQGHRSTRCRLRTASGS